MNRRLQHTIDFTDESTPTGRTEPAGVIGSRNRRGPDPSRDRERVGSDRGRSAAGRSARAGVPGRRHARPVHTRSRRRAGRQAGPSHAAIGQLARENGPCSEPTTATVGA